MSLFSLIFILVVGSLIYLNMSPSREVGLDTDTFVKTDAAIPSNKLGADVAQITPEIIANRQSMMKQVQESQALKLRQQREREEDIKMTMASNLVKNAERIATNTASTEHFADYAPSDAAPLPESLKLLQPVEGPSRADPRPSNESGFYQSADFRSEMTIDWNDKIGNAVKPHMFKEPQGIVDPTEWQRFLADSDTSSPLLKAQNTGIVPYTSPDNYGKLK